ncbi:MAG TPA: hypothetical protein VGM90_14815 [Kofleriaceae bacterium]
MGVTVSDQTIADAWERGRAACAELDVSRETFAKFAGDRAETWAGTLERAADLYVACACATGAPNAAESFLERYAAHIATYLGRLGSDRDLVDEVRQVVLVRCLLGDGDKLPAITSYSGRGSLEGWVRATAVREALALRRDRGRHVDLDESPAETASAEDHELPFMVGHYREPVLRAFSTAVAALPREHRTLLRLHYVYAVTTADLAQMFRVSRATLVRRITEARDGLFALLQSALFGQAGVPPEDCESVLRLVKSQVDLSLSSLLRSAAA